MSRKKNKLRASLKDKIKARNREKATERKGSSVISLPDGASFIDIKKGTRYFDIIPYEVKATNNPTVDPGEIWYERTYFRHGNIGTENKSVICPLKTIRSPCPICEHRALLMKNYEDNKEQIRMIRPSERQLFNVIDIKSDNKDIKILDMSHFCFGDVLETELLEEEESGCFPDLIGGLTLRVRFQEDTFDRNKFRKADRIDFLEREDYKDEIIDETVDLDSILNILTYKQIETLFFENGEEEEEEIKPSTRRRSRKKEEEPEEEEEEEEEEEIKPSTRRRSRKKEEEEEEIKPSTRRRSRKKEEEPEEEEEEEEIKPSTRRRSRKKEEEPEEEEEEEEINDCPYGHTFGASNDDHKQCIDCDIWQECKGEQEALEQQ